MTLKKKSSKINIQTINLSITKGTCTFPRLFYLLDPDPHLLYADPCGSGSETLIMLQKYLIFFHPNVSSYGREFGMFVKHCKVEIYYTEFLLADHSNPELTVRRKFSKADKLGQ